jgi:propanol-preferring alcohol dehydrogenase
MTTTMNAMLLERPGAIDTAPLRSSTLPVPEPHADEILIRVKTCGVCHTDLHAVEGEIAARLPIVPGHQVVGIVERVGSLVTDLKPGDRVGVPWLHRTCGKCDLCRNDLENLCDVARFTGFHVNGGFAEHVVAVADYAVRIPDAYDDLHAAPLLCAGIVGFRAYRLSGPSAGMRLGLYGFGASAHLVIQVAVYQGCEVLVATRSKDHQKLAQDLGAGWVGRAEEVPSHALDAAIIFAPAGTLVPEALRALRKAGTLVLAGIYMTPLPVMKYDLLYHERVIRSVANATRADAQRFMEIAGQHQLRTEVTAYPLADANRALLDMKQSHLRSAAVLQV